MIFKVSNDIKLFAKNSEPFENSQERFDGVHDKGQIKKFMIRSR